jgi:hypothetical protein
VGRYRSIQVPEGEVNAHLSPSTLGEPYAVDLDSRPVLLDVKT